MHEYWQAIHTFSPSLRRFILSSALTTTVAFGLSAVLTNLYLLRLGFDARFMHIWEFYLAYCEAAFATGNTSVMQFTLQRD